VAGLRKLMDIIQRAADFSGGRKVCLAIGVFDGCILAPTDHQADRDRRNGQ
jgi:hypothetical protein